MIAFEILLRSQKRLKGRLSCVDYARSIQHVPMHQGDLSPHLPIWQFWATGVDEAPPIVRRCMQSVVEFASDRPVIVLDANSYHKHVKIPEHIEQQRERIGWTHFSDLLRSRLLATHGGIWIDGTVLLSAPIPNDLSSLPFFAFTRSEDPFLFSSWFMQSVPGHPIIVALQNMLESYWIDHETQIDYFLFHFMFEAAVSADPYLRSLWMETPVRNADLPHRLQACLAEPLDRPKLDQTLASSWIHKLTWKMPPGAERLGSFADALSSHDHQRGLRSPVLFASDG